METVSDQLRRAIRESGMSQYRLSQESGVSAATLSRFMAGADLRTDSLDPIASVLGLELRKARKPRARKEAR